MSVAAVILAASLTLPDVQSRGAQLLQIAEAPLTYRANRRDPATRAYPQVEVRCEDRTMHLRFTGLNLPQSRQQPIQIKIGNWHERLVRTEAQNSFSLSSRYPGLMNAIGTRGAMEVTVSNKTYRLRPMNARQHSAFVRQCDMTADAAVGHDPVQSLRDEPLLD